MAQHTIAIADAPYEMLMEAKKRLHERGSMFSSSRLIHYLVDFEQWMLDAYSQAVNGNMTAAEQATFLRNEIARCLANKPSVLPRGGYKPSRNATVEQRILASQQIEARLGIPNPPRELVNYFLDNRDALHLRAAVRRREAHEKEIEGLKMGEQPDTGAQP